MIELGQLPRPLAWLCLWLGAALGFVVGRVLGVRRSHAVACMRRAGVRAPERVAAQMYAGLGSGLFELLASAWVRPRRSSAPIALPRGPAVVLTAHTGNWDFCACAVANAAPLAVVTKRLELGWVDRLWQRVRAGHGVQLLSSGGAARGVAQALREGKLVAMMIDQAPERERGTIVAPFLGAPARVDLAPALLALRGRAPVIVALPVRLPGGAHGVVVVGRFEPPAQPRRAWAEGVMRAATAMLDAHVRQHPEQWLWMHRRWKDAPALPRAFDPTTSDAVLALPPRAGRNLSRPLA
jgi:KDO2-lipid IV(A) lauroyltransferase